MNPDIKIYYVNFRKIEMNSFWKKAYDFFFLSLSNQYRSISLRAKESFFSKNHTFKSNEACKKNLTFKLIWKCHFKSFGPRKNLAFESNEA